MGRKIPDGLESYRSRADHHFYFLSVGGCQDELEQEGVNPKALNIARVWALAGCRRDEIAGLTWAEVNLEEGLQELEDSKTGKSIRPLGAAAVALLKSIERQDGSDFVFPAERGDGNFQGIKTMWSEAIEKARLSVVTPHAVRHTMGSTATSTGEVLALSGAVTRIPDLQQSMRMCRTTRPSALPTGHLQKR